MKYRWPEFCPSSDRKMRYQVEDRIMTIARRKCRWRLELYHTQRERERERELTVRLREICSTGDLAFSSYDRESNIARLIVFRFGEGGFTIRSIVKLDSRPGR